jgi:hypothetical protein
VTIDGARHAREILTGPPKFHVGQHVTVHRTGATRSGTVEQYAPGIYTSGDYLIKFPDGTRDFAFASWMTDDTNPDTNPTCPACGKVAKEGELH